MVLCADLYLISVLHQHEEDVRLGAAPLHNAGDDGVPACHQPAVLTDLHRQAGHVLVDGQYDLLLVEA